MTSKLTAVVVARKGSTRVKDKHWRVVGGDPQILRKVKQLQKSKYIDRIIVGSDDDSLKPIIESTGAIFVRRPDEFCDEISRTPNEMIANMLTHFESEYVLWAHPTNPLIGPTWYDQAFLALQGAETHGFKSLFSVSKIQSHMWFNRIPLNFNPSADTHVLAKDLEPVYKMNGGIFIHKYLDLVARPRFVGDAPYMFELPDPVGLDIDYEWELKCAQALAIEE